MDLKSGVWVLFEGEEGAGVGVKREWFRAITEELFNINNGLFITTRTGQYSPAQYKSV